MRYISAHDIERDAAGILQAAQKEPLTVRDGGKDVAVLLSVADYRRMHRAAGRTAPEDAARHAAAVRARMPEPLRIDVAALIREDRDNR